MDSAAIGKLNQALYFARQHCRRAESFGDDVQQGQPSLDAALDCLYRALFFLSFSILSERSDRAALEASPESWAARLEAAQARSPSPQCALLLQALADSRQLAGLLVTQRALFSCTTAATSARAIPLLDNSLSPEACLRWAEQIARLSEQFQCEGREE